MKKHLLIIVSALVSVLSLNLIAVTATEPTVKNIYYDDVYSFSEGMSRVV